MSLALRATERTWVALQNPALELANTIAATDFVPKSLRGNPAAITAAILYGDEVGLGPMMSLSKIAVIDGRPALSSEAQRALILSAGHELWIEESNTTRCTVAGRRRGSDQTSRVTWTLDDAKRAGIGGKQNWRMYPRQMLQARATAELARLVFADAIGGLAAIEEFDEIDENATPDDGVSSRPVPASSSRRRRKTATATTTTIPALTAVDDDPSPPLVPDEDSAPLGDSAENAVGMGTEDSAETADLSSPSPIAEPELMTDGQRRRMMAAFRDRGFIDRTHRLAFTRRIIGRSIESSNELTVGEASIVLLALEAGEE